MALWGFLEKLGRQFYIVDPAKNSFETIEEVPDYVTEAFPIFLILFVTEQFVLWIKRKPTFRFNDSLGSLTQGTLEELTKIFFRGWIVVAYIYVYNNWRVADLPFNSLWTWWIALIGIDFFYYWGHRASHEINFLWAMHQVHHSSEEYNLSTALRQSIFQGYVLSFFYLPMALLVPPAVYLVHMELNLIFQFWIHTEVIQSLGPLEYIINTASHHRVHHGRNRYCIDKNYAGALIIWDRIFGTFEPEGEKVVYGLTHPINTFEPLYIQFCHTWHIIKTFWETPGFGNKMSVIFKGPGWAPGLPWHGRLEDIPDVKDPVEKYNPVIPFWCTLYIFLHFLFVGFGSLSLSSMYQVLPLKISCLLAVYIVISLSILGMLSDGRSYAPWLELIRCISYMLIDYFIFPITGLVPFRYPYKEILVLLIRITYAASLLGWIKGSIVAISIKLHSGKKVE